MTQMLMKKSCSKEMCKKKRVKSNFGLHSLSSSEPYGKENAPSTEACGNKAARF
ncbi:hypothetical protein [Pseudophaeobacter sp.]|uniref:hypothetical protein n=1 Tax=Pseudophaeobacter sp. TaxID=1971739 RepID=UPI0032998AA1